MGWEERESSMLLKVLLLLCVGLLQAEDSAIEIGDRFTVRTEGSNRNGNVRAIAISPDGSEVTVSTRSGLIFIRSSDGEVTHKREESPFSIAYSADGSRLYAVGERDTKLLRIADKSEMATSLNRPRGYVGLQLTKKNGKIVVSRRDKGSPAAAAKQLDEGVEIVGFADGLSDKMQSVVGMEIDELYRKFDGAASSEFRLDVIPRGKIEEETVVLTRMMITGNGNGQSFAKFKPTYTKETSLWCMSDGFHELRSSFDGSYISSFSFADFSNRRGTPSVSRNGAMFAWVAKYNEPHNAKSTFASNDDSSTEGFSDAVVGITTESLGYSRGADSFYGVEVRNVHTKELIASFPVGLDPSPSGGRLFLGIQLDTDAHRLIVTTRTCFHVYDMNDGKRIRMVELIPESESESIYCSATSGKIGAAGDGKGLVRVVNLETGELLSKIKCREKSHVDQMAFSKDGSVLSYHVDGVIHVVNLVQK